MAVLVQRRLVIELLKLELMEVLKPQFKELEERYLELLAELLLEVQLKEQPEPPRVLVMPQPVGQLEEWLEEPLLMRALGQLLVAPRP